MFGKWEVRPLVYQINLPPFSSKVDKRTKELNFIFGIFVHTELSISHLTLIWLDTCINNSPQYHCYCLCLIYRTDMDIQKRKISRQHFIERKQLVSPTSSGLSLFTKQILVAAHWLPHRIHQRVG